MFLCRTACLILNIILRSFLSSSYIVSRLLAATNAVANAGFTPFDSRSDLKISRSSTPTKVFDWITTTIKRQLSNTKPSGDELLLLLCWIVQHANNPLILLRGGCFNIFTGILSQSGAVYTIKKPHNDRRDERRVAWLWYNLSYHRAFDIMWCEILGIVFPFGQVNCLHRWAVLIAIFSSHIRGSTHKKRG